MTVLAPAPARAAGPAAPFGCQAAPQRNAMRRAPLEERCGTSSPQSTNGMAKGVVAYCPEVPGANGQGRSKDEARKSLAEAIALILVCEPALRPRRLRTRVEY